MQYLYHIGQLCKYPFTQVEISVQNPVLDTYFTVISKHQPRFIHSRVLSVQKQILLNILQSSFINASNATNILV